jgi:hypothetical protein
MSLSQDWIGEQPEFAGGLSLRVRMRETLRSLSLIDITVVSLLIAFGALQFYFCERAKEFLYDDVFYADCARSLIQHGFYGINGRPETNQPPGLPAILALLDLARLSTHLVFLRAMVVFETTGILVSYLLLRRQAPKAVAAGICLLLISSVVPFTLATQWVFPAFPYFFVTMSALFVAMKLDEATDRKSRVGWTVLLAALVAGSLIIATAAIALLAAIIARLVISSFRDRQVAFQRLKPYLAILVVGLAVQGLWMQRKAAPLEWPTQGYPRPYLQQLWVKSGNYPELGMATLRDIPVRVEKNVFDTTRVMTQILFRRWIALSWLSVLVLGPMLLALLGWFYSVWKTGGGIQEWYFAGYEFIYLLWPWTMEVRFILPVAPLVCFYIWRGVEAIGFLAKNKARLLGLAWLPASIFLALNTWSWMHGRGDYSHLPHTGLQDELSFATWSFTGLLAGWMILRGAAWQSTTIRFWEWYKRPAGSWKISPLHVSQLLAGTVAVILVIQGLPPQLEVGRANLDVNSAMNRVPPDVEAASWVQLNTSTNAIVMARQVPTVSHYSSRRVVWFPPSSNPRLLMEGIRKHRVEYVVVTQRRSDYYLPPDGDCFAPLLAAYPEAFRSVYQAPAFKIYQVIAEAPPTPVAQSDSD